MIRKRILLLAGAAFLTALLFVVFVVGSTLTCSRHLYARVQVKKIAAMIEQYRIDTGECPTALEQLLEPGPEQSEPYIREIELRDAWFRPWYYRVENNGRFFVLFTLGKDGRIGGDDADADFGAQCPEQIHSVIAGKSVRPIQGEIP